MSFLLNDINDLQTRIMIFIKDWANTEKTPIPQKKIIEYMITKKIKNYTVQNALYSLLTKGYIRKAVDGSPKSSRYIMIRNISA